MIEEGTKIMSNGQAHVEDVDALRQLRTTMIKFAEAASVAMNDAESELRRVLTWLELEQDSYWQQQIRKRHDICERCKEAVRMKKLFKSATGHQQSAIDEEKALKIALARLEEAQHKLANVKKWRGRLTKEIDIYKGSVQRLTTTVQVDIPLAAGRLSKMIQRLEAYIALKIPMSEALPAEALAGMAGMGLSGSEAGEGAVLADPRNLRRSTPPDSVRAAAIATEAPPELALASIGEADLARLDGLNLADKPIEPASTICIAPEAARSKHVYFERMEPANPTDSGWYLGPADDVTIEPPLAVPIAAILALRPDFEKILNLPPHVLVVASDGAIAHVIDGQNRELRVE